jgi:uncharacterized protein YoxC
MASVRTRRALGSSVTVLAVFAIAAPGAMAKQAALDGQLIGDASKAGSKVVAPVLLTGQSAKKLKLRSPLATLSMKASKGVPVPNPTGAGIVTVTPDTLRSGDEIDGKGKLKGSSKKLMPIVKAGSLNVTDRESAYSVDELTAAVVGLFSRVGALELKVADLESAISGIRAELEELKRQNSGLSGQINSILGQLNSLTTQLNSLTSLVNGLPSAAALNQALADIAALQADLNALEAVVNDPTTGLAALQTQLTTLQGDVTDLLALCEPPSAVAALC